MPGATQALDMEAVPGFRESARLRKMIEASRPAGKWAAVKGIASQWRDYHDCDHWACHIAGHIPPPHTPRMVHARPQE